jgi:hypothetical protein
MLLALAAQHIRSLVHAWKTGTEASVEAALGKLRDDPTIVCDSTPQEWDALYEQFHRGTSTN